MKRRTLFLAAGVVAVLGGMAYANRYPQEHLVMSQMHGMGAGHMGGMGMGHMFQGVDTTAEEEAELRAMFEGHRSITRTVENLPNGIRTVTETCQRQSKSEPKGRAKCCHFWVGMIAA